METTENPQPLTPVCKTQDNFDEREAMRINVGLGRIAPRWIPQSTLKYVVDTASFPSAAEAGAGAATMKKAVDEWNSHNFGVTIAQVDEKSTAHFDLKYTSADDDPELEGVLAWAFFPGERERHVYVTKLGMGPTFLPQLKGTLLHELGHVFGLRHEFALYSKAELAALGIPDEDDMGAVQIMGKNVKSVMNYLPTEPEIQQSDVDGLKAFYKFSNGFSLGPKSKVHDMPPKILT